ncbi:Protein-lysine N-methyltransferase efm5 [Dispira parvispora]|uniref:Protein-lysine N-methyltransferase EFM5 n=1 Tax=Dispira parvispora TaxID=1520584 RepID=A0A9W8E5U5_9FUNG|nr:Protein-lysine N-methyltransferase efm5 [Dispira parvispora]
MDDYDDLQLSGHALAALQEFIQEQQLTQGKVATPSALPTVDSVDSGVDTTPKFSEDWKLSQFWYHDTTAEFYAQLALRYAVTESQGPVAFVSSPTAFIKLKELEDGPTEAFLLEYDSRFATYGEQFVKYDFHKPLELGSFKAYKGRMKCIFVDPPYLEEDCLTKTALTVRYLAAPDCKILISTGFVVRELVQKLFEVKPTTYEPRHQNGLANEFRLYTNFESKELRWDI